MRIESSLFLPARKNIVSGLALLPAGSKANSPFSPLPAGKKNFFAARKTRTLARRGFSQIELLVAVAVLAVGFLAVFGGLAYSLRATRTAGEMSEAANLNRRLIELVRTRVEFENFPAWSIYVTDSDTVRKPLNAPPFQDQSFTEGDRFRRNIRVDRVSSDPNDYRSKLWHIQVGVFWAEDRKLIHHAYYRQE